MSREEAIKELTDLLPEEFLSEYTNAIKMAIEALEQEPVLNRVKEEIKDNTYFINATTEKEGIDFETVEKIIDKYTGRGDTAIKVLEQEPCEDAISRQAAIRLAEQGQIQGYEWQFKELNKLPPVTPQQKMGRWIDIDDSKSECSICGHREFNERFLFEDINFCAKCGAKMVEPQKGSDKE